MGRREMAWQTHMTRTELKAAGAYHMQGHALLIVGDEGAYYSFDTTREGGANHWFKLSKTIPITDQHRAMLPTLNKF